MYTTAHAYHSRTTRERLAVWRRAHPLEVRLICFALGGLSVWVVFLLLALRARASIWGFRAAWPVSVPPTSSDIELAGELSQLLLRDNGQRLGCGLTASHAGYYKQTLVVRLRGSVEPLVMFNPMYDNTTDGARWTVVEPSLFCANQTDTQTRNRLVRVDVEYVSSFGTNSKVRLYSDDAFCVQQHIDVLHGEWPCSTTRAAEPNLVSVRGGSEL